MSKKKSTVTKQPKSDGMYIIANERGEYYWYAEDGDGHDDEFGETMVTLFYTAAEATRRRDELGKRYLTEPGRSLAVHRLLGQPVSVVKFKSKLMEDVQKRLKKPMSQADEAKLEKILREFIDKYGSEGGHAACAFGYE